MAHVPSKEPLITSLARKVGRAAGKIATATQGMAASAAAIVTNNVNQPDVPVAKAPPLSAHTSKQHSVRRKPTNKAANSTAKRTPKKTIAKKATGKKKSHASPPWKKKSAPSR